MIGYYGHPPREVLEEARARFGNDFIDLDVATGAPPSGVLPRAYCKILSNIVDNAVNLGDRLDVIVASVGEEKCDGGRNVAVILEKMGFNVVQTTNTNRRRRPVTISTSGLPLKEKLDRIMASVVGAQPRALPGCRPTHGFWGVPPNDYSLLDLFPPTTHVYGWTRCVEAGVPSDLELELHVDAEVPTVFFTQSFCAKQALAKFLAGKSGGLCIDIDTSVTDSILAKVEAFIALT